ncbi:hypothetical protein B0H65DRAFT_50254 [Neurospora tetraspora]|uniref:Uncharacterized protein n=1 Tax=Neurospora tetraspora TaxID=94610 RepID=A0AAE0JQC4_9PEZI|nr:hypothetical protein B0H65DRAFT_50254 [Neurospora tetraspora]
MTTNNNLADTATLIQLKGEKNLGDWESALWVALDCANLTDYVFSPKDKPEPKDKDSEKYETWRANRARAVAAIHSTLKAENIRTILQINGWDPKNRDPSYHFQLIQKAIAKVTDEARADVLHEYLSLKRQSFDTIESFLSRYNVCRKRVADAGLKIDDELEMVILFNMVRDRYPIEARLWAVDMEKKTLLPPVFLGKLSTIGNSEKRNPTLSVSTQVNNTNNTNKNNSNDKGKDGKDNKDKKRETEKCSTCNRDITKGHKHFDCGHHRNPKTPDCWMCNPEKAPDTWRKKKELMEAKSAGTAAATADTNNGLTHPSSKSSLLYGSVNNFMALSRDDSDSDGNQDFW